MILFVLLLIYSVHYADSQTITETQKQNKNHLVYKHHKKDVAMYIYGDDCYVDLQYDSTEGDLVVYITDAVLTTEEASTLAGDQLVDFCKGKQIYMVERNPELVIDSLIQSSDRSKREANVKTRPQFAQNHNSDYEQSHGYGYGQNSYSDYEKSRHPNYEQTRYSGEQTNENTRANTGRKKSNHDTSQRKSLQFQNSTSIDLNLFRKQISEHVPHYFTSGSYHVDTSKLQVFSYRQNQNASQDSQGSQKQHKGGQQGSVHPSYHYQQKGPQQDSIHQGSHYQHKEGQRSQHAQEQRYQDNHRGSPSSNQQTQQHTYQDNQQGFSNDHQDTGQDTYQNNQQAHFNNNQDFQHHGYKDNRQMYSNGNENRGQRRYQNSQKAYYSSNQQHRYHYNQRNYPNTSQNTQQQDNHQGYPKNYKATQQHRYQNSQQRGYSNSSQNTQQHSYQNNQQNYPNNNQRTQQQGYQDNEQNYPSDSSNSQQQGYQNNQQGSNTNQHIQQHSYQSSQRDYQQQDVQQQDYQNNQQDYSNNNRDAQQPGYQDNQQGYFNNNQETQQQSYQNNQQSYLNDNQNIQQHSYQNYQHNFNKNQLVHQNNQQAFHSQDQKVSSGKVHQVPFQLSQNPYNFRKNNDYWKHNKAAQEKQNVYNSYLIIPQKTYIQQDSSQYATQSNKSSSYQDYNNSNNSPNNQMLYNTQSNINLASNNYRGLGFAGSKAKYDTSNSQTQVQGSYSGFGSFSSQARSENSDTMSQSKIIGTSSGIIGSASSSVGNLGKSSSHVSLQYPPNSSKANAGSHHGKNYAYSQAQGDEDGGQAASQASGLSATSSQVRIGLKQNNNYPVKPEGDKKITRSGSASTYSDMYNSNSQSRVFGQQPSGKHYVSSSQAKTGHYQPSRGQSTSFQTRRQTTAQDYKVPVMADKNARHTQTSYFQDDEQNVTAIHQQPSFKHYNKFPTSNPRVSQHPFIPNSQQDMNEQIRTEKPYQQAYNKTQVTLSQTSINHQHNIPNSANPRQTPKLTTAPAPWFTTTSIPSFYSSTSQVNPQSNRLNPSSPTTPGNNTTSTDQKIIPQYTYKSKTVTYAGDRIPGFPGYQIPQGFRAKIYSGDTAPLKVSSAKALRGFNTHVYPPRQSEHRTVSVIDGSQTSQLLLPNKSLRVSILQDPIYDGTSSQHGTASQNARSSYTANISSNDGYAGVHGSYPTQQPKVSHTYYSNQSPCGYVSFSCNIIYKSRNKIKVCKPKPLDVSCCC